MKQAMYVLRILTSSSLELTPESYYLTQSSFIYSLKVARESWQPFSLPMFVVAAVDDDNDYCPLVLR